VTRPQREILRDLVNRVGEVRRDGTVDEGIDSPKA
jgi:hypothetical protein